MIYSMTKKSLIPKLISDAMAEGTNEWRGRKRGTIIAKQVIVGLRYRHTH